MRKIYMIFNAGSGNRGCEAIVRGTNILLSGYDKTVFTSKFEEDKKSGLVDDIECISLQNAIGKIKKYFIYIICGLSYKFGNGFLQVKLIYPNLWKMIKPDDAYFIIGGDVYCYGKPYIYYHINNILKKNPKILWGCSIEPDSIDDEMKKDLLSYDLIYARESITYNALINSGINKNTKLFPDPAFAMGKIELPLPNGFIENKTVGINVSPLIIDCEKESGITLKNYIKLIEYIIKNTEFNIALIPHVIWKNNDDRTPLKVLYERFRDTGRIVMIEAVSAEKIKGYIARCRFMIAARTHASIAAYSTCVPTLVVGYSVKARGIAKDIFGDHSNYVIPVQDLKEEEDLTKAFKWILERENEIRDHLNSFIPQYCKRLDKVKEEVERIIG